MKLEGKIALVTGASQGLGKAIALKLAENGADVAIIFVGPQEPALETKAEIEALGRRAECYPCDVRDEQAMEGSSWVERAFMLLKPATPMGMMAASAPPVSTASK